MYILGANMYILGTDIHPLGTKASLLKRYSPSDRFWTFFSESVAIFFICFGNILLQKKSAQS